MSKSFCVLYTFWNVPLGNKEPRARESHTSGYTGAIQFSLLMRLSGEFSCLHALSLSLSSSCVCVDPFGLLISLFFGSDWHPNMTPLSGCLPFFFFLSFLQLPSPFSTPLTCKWYGIESRVLQQQCGYLPSVLYYIKGNWAARSIVALYTIEI